MVNYYRFLTLCSNLTVTIAIKHPRCQVGTSVSEITMRRLCYGHEIDNGNTI